jgi:hypothetical protein
MKMRSIALVTMNFLLVTSLRYESNPSNIWGEP